MSDLKMLSGQLDLEGDNDLYYGYGTYTLTHMDGCDDVVHADVQIKIYQSYKRRPFDSEEMIKEQALAQIEETGLSLRYANIEWDIE
jgi:hypothetical protein